MKRCIGKLAGIAALCALALPGCSRQSAATVAAQQAIKASTASQTPADAAGAREQERQQEIHRLQQDRIVVQTVPKMSAQDKAKAVADIDKKLSQLSGR